MAGLAEQRAERPDHRGLVVDDEDLQRVAGRADRDALTEHAHRPAGPTQTSAWIGLEASSPALEALLVREQDEHGVLASQRAFLLVEARFVDRLGDRARPCPTRR